MSWRRKNGTHSASVPLEVDIAPMYSRLIEEEARFKGCPKWRALELLLDELLDMRRKLVNLPESLAIPKRIQ